MKALKIIVGIIAALVVLFAGGCSLIFFGMSTYDWLQGSSTAFMNTDVIAMFGVASALIAGGIAWLCFKKYRGETS